MDWMDIDEALDGLESDEGESSPTNASSMAPHVLGGSHAIASKFSELSVGKPACGIGSLHPGTWPTASGAGSTERMSSLEADLNVNNLSSKYGVDQSGQGVDGSMMPAEAANLYAIDPASQFCVKSTVGHINSNGALGNGILSNHESAVLETTPQNAHLHSYPHAIDTKESSLMPSLVSPTPANFPPSRYDSFTPKHDRMLPPSYSRSTKRQHTTQQRPQDQSQLYTEPNTVMSYSLPMVSAFPAASPPAQSFNPQVSTMLSAPSTVVASSSETVSHSGSSLDTGETLTSFSLSETPMSSSLITRNLQPRQLPLHAQPNVIPAASSAVSSRSMPNSATPLPSDKPIYQKSGHIKSERHRPSSNLENPFARSRPIASGVTVSQHMNQQQVPHQLLPKHNPGTSQPTLACSQSFAGPSQAVSNVSALSTGQALQHTSLSETLTLTTVAPDAVTSQHQQNVSMGSSTCVLPAVIEVSHALGHSSLASQRLHGDGGNTQSMSSSTLGQEVSKSRHSARVSGLLSGVALSSQSHIDPVSMETVSANRVGIGLNTAEESSPAAGTSDVICPDHEHLEVASCLPSDLVTVSGYTNRTSLSSTTSSISSSTHADVSTEHQRTPASAEYPSAIAAVPLYPHPSGDSLPSPSTLEAAHQSQINFQRCEVTSLSGTNRGPAKGPLSDITFPDLDSVVETASAATSDSVSGPVRPLAVSHISRIATSLPSFNQRMTAQQLSSDPLPAAHTELSVDGYFSLSSSVSVALSTQNAGARSKFGLLDSLPLPMDDEPGRSVARAPALGNSNDFFVPPPMDFQDSDEDNESSRSRGSNSALPLGERPPVQTSSDRTMVTGSLMAKMSPALQMRELPDSTNRLGTGGLPSSFSSNNGFTANFGITLPTLDDEQFSFVLDPSAVAEGTASDSILSSSWKKEDFQCLSGGNPDNQDSFAVDVADKELQDVRTPRNSLSSIQEVHHNHTDVTSLGQHPAESTVDQLQSLSMIDRLPAIIGPSVAPLAAFRTVSPVYDGNNPNILGRFSLTPPPMTENALLTANNLVTASVSPHGYHSYAVDRDPVTTSVSLGPSRDLVPVDDLRRVNERPVGGDLPMAIVQSNPEGCGALNDEPVSVGIEDVLPDVRQYMDHEVMSSDIRPPVSVHGARAEQPAAAITQSDADHEQASGVLDRSQWSTGRIHAAQSSPTIGFSTVDVSAVDDSELDSLLQDMSLGDGNHSHTATSIYTAVSSPFTSTRDSYPNMAPSPSGGGPVDLGLRRNLLLEANSIHPYIPHEAGSGGGVSPALTVSPSNNPLLSANLVAMSPNTALGPSSHEFSVVDRQLSFDGSLPPPDVSVSEGQRSHEGGHFLPVKNDVGIDVSDLVLGGEMAGRLHSYDTLADVTALPPTRVHESGEGFVPEYEENGRYPSFAAPVSSPEHFYSEPGHSLSPLNTSDTLFIADILHPAVSSQLLVSEATAACLPNSLLTSPGNNSLLRTNGIIPRSEAASEPVHLVRSDSNTSSAATTDYPPDISPPPYPGNSPGFLNTGHSPGFPIAEGVGADAHDFLGLPGVAYQDNINHGELANEEPDRFADVAIEEEEDSPPMGARRHLSRVSVSHRNAIPGQLRDDLPSEEEDDERDESGVAGEVRGEDAPPPYHEEQQEVVGMGEAYMDLGSTKPLWMPDSEADYCLECSQPFTMLRRRHHCRSCGRIFCNKCTQGRAMLEYLDFKSARVCIDCHTRIMDGQLQQMQLLSGGSEVDPSSHPHPLPHGSPHPSGLLSSHAAMEADGSHSHVGGQSPVLTSVLRRPSTDHSGQTNRPARQVSFFDGVRPGGETSDASTTSTTGSSGTRTALGEGLTARGTTSGRGTLPPVAFLRKDRSVVSIDGTPDEGQIVDAILRLSSVGDDVSEEDASSVSFVLHKDLQVVVSCALLDCCVGQFCWMFVSRGLATVSQDEIVLILECSAEELDKKELPLEIFSFYLLIHQQASQGVVVSEMDVTILPSRLPALRKGVKFLMARPPSLPEALPAAPGVFEGEVSRPADVSGAHEGEVGGASSILSPSSGALEESVDLSPGRVEGDVGGVLYIRHTFQCLQKLSGLPSAPYLFGLFIHRKELAWARVCPLRLMLRLGAEYRYYPCPLVSKRERGPLYKEVGHTIMNLLADFSKFTFTLTLVTGLTILMENKTTTISFPRSCYNQVMRVLQSSNEYVVALGSWFCEEADSHLVCVQTPDGNYVSQAINIQAKPRQVTGASFVVFSGALKSSSGLTAKSNIVEDGLMVQIHPDMMNTLKDKLKNMEDMTIGCGHINSEDPEETVKIKWVEEFKKFNVGVLSPIDGFPMDGVECLRVFKQMEGEAIRWTEVFFIQNERPGGGGGAGVGGEGVDAATLQRLAEGMAHACVTALGPHAEALRERSMRRIGLRVNLSPDQVGYDIGSCQEHLPEEILPDLDTELVPVIHQSAAAEIQGGVLILELIFHVLETEGP